MPEYMKFLCSQVTCSLRILSNLCFCFFFGVLVGEITATQRNDPTRRIRTLTRFCLIQASLDACLIKKDMPINEYPIAGFSGKLLLFFLHKIISYSLFTLFITPQLAKLQFTAKRSK